MIGPENIAEILTRRFASGDPDTPLTLDLHESHMLIAALRPLPASIVPSRAPEDVLPWLKRLSRLFSEGCDDSREHMKLVVDAAAEEIERLRMELQEARELYEANHG